jgi:2-polyprenyl-3-methyl-5-hydroxy-6-metoxy-1,4-benzoquinol methylase
MEQLLADELKRLWRRVEANELLREDFSLKHQQGLAAYTKIWSDALLLEGYHDLPQSLVHELGLYLKCQDLAELQLHCSRAVENLANLWRDKVDPRDRISVENFYNETEEEIYELMWWHTLADDLSPLAYVTALQFAQREGCRSCLDFGAGVGSGSLLFVKDGLNVGLADISSPLLEFSRWRFQLRRLPGEFFDLKTSDLPNESFDMVTAMDVFEHLVDPLNAVKKLSDVLKPGGFLFGRFSAEPNEDRPMHVVQDFGPTLSCLRNFGFIEVWRDDWLWGHQVFQKR